MNDNSLPQALSRIQRPAMIVGVAGLALCLVGAIISPRQFFQSWHFAFLFWLGIALGCMAMVMLNHLVGGEWGRLIRRPAEAAAMTLPLMFLAFVPLLFGLDELYDWAAPNARGHQQTYLNIPFFITRAAIYFILWIGLAFLLRKWSLQRDRTGDARLSRRLLKLSAAGLVIYFFTMSFASIDWIMSREAHWYSTIIGFLITMGQALSGLAFVIAVLGLIADKPPFAEAAKPGHFIDLGNLLLTLVVFWAYISFAQFLIIWMGNTQEEVIWYIRRTRGGWGAIAIILILFHFFLPFFLLVSRENKSRIRILAAVSAGILFLRMVDVFWIVSPSGQMDFHVSWLDIAAAVGIGGIWITVFIGQLKGKPLLAPLISHEPETLDYGNRQAAGGLG